MLDKKHVAFPGRLVIVGFGSIGQGVLPLLLRHLEIAPARITIVTAEPRGHDVAAEYGVRFIETALTRENYRALLEPLLGDGDFLLNVSVEVSSMALIELCQERGALYLDTCIEPWPGGYTDPEPAAVGSLELRAARERAGAAPPLSARPDRGPDARRQSRPRLAFRQAGADRSRARMPASMAASREPAPTGPISPRRLGIKVIHIAERDTQVATRAQDAGRVRQYLVDRRLCQRGLAARRARLGDA